MMTPTQYTQSPGRLSPEQDSVRLRASEGSALDGSAQWAVSLLREAEPYRLAPGRKERVWNALPGARFTRHTRLRFAFALGALTVSGLFASAALAQWPAWLASAIDRFAAPSSQDPSTTPVSKIARSRHAVPDEPTVVPRLSPPTSEPTVALPKPETPQSPHPRRALKATSPEDLQPLLDAIRALRVEHNPTRARALLTAYLDRYPRSELAEEALVTLIQAAAAHHDSDVQALAARYFKTYPRGTFRSSVDQTLGTGSERAQTPVKGRND
jgi:hypothetical protein